MSTVVELAELWARFVREVEESREARDRCVALTKADGGMEVLFIDKKTSELRHSPRTAAEVEWQADYLRGDVDKCVVLLKAVFTDAEGRPSVGFIFPEAVDAIRACLSEGGQEAPEVDLYEFYEAPHETKGP